MGIPAYFSFIVKNHLNILRKHQKDVLEINNLYLDANSIIYDAIRHIDFSSITTGDIQHIIRNVVRKISSYIESIKPNNSVMIAFDGVAPVAKLEQQRQRRYKSQYTTQIQRTIFKDPKRDPFNTTAITPGTVFMRSLNQGIRDHFCNPSFYNVKTILLSLSDVAGEGEHKIFQHIRNYADEHKDQSTVIYGLDADLIMLSLNHLHISSRIYLFRETPEFIRSISADLEPNELYYLEIYALGRAISEQLSGGAKDEDEPFMKEKMFDYILICFFLGNDFMPHFPALNIRTGGVDKVLNAYKATIPDHKSITYFNENHELHIHWSLLREFVVFLASLEHQFIMDETKLRDKMSKRYYPNSTPEEAMIRFDAMPTFMREKELRINPFKNGWNLRYYEELFGFSNLDEGSENQVKAVCQNFMETLFWTFKYYSEGCIDWRFKYNFAYPPLLQDLVYSIPSRDGDFFLNPVAETKSIDELTQLCYVLPRNCLYLLPKGYEDALLRHHNEWYVSKCSFTWAYCRYFWECHADLPHVSIEQMEKTLASLKEKSLMKKKD